MGLIPLMNKLKLLSNIDKCLAIKESYNYPYLYLISLGKHSEYSPPDKDINNHLKELNVGLYLVSVILECVLIDKMF